MSVDSDHPLARLYVVFRDEECYATFLVPEFLRAYIAAHPGTLRIDDPAYGMVWTNTDGFFDTGLEKTQLWAG